MQPTMNLRWKQVNLSGDMTVSPSSVQIYGTNIYFILQQWWEGAKIKKEYEHLSPNSLIAWDGKSELLTYEPYGEWRDIPIEVKEK